MSTIKVNKLEQRTGCTATVGGGAGKTVVLCGSTITLGRCGGTVSLASGATQSGFGRTGTVDWCTTAKTSPFTAANGKGYFINTTCGAVTVTLPSSPSAGDIVAFNDVNGKFDCNQVTLCRNGSKLKGGCTNLLLKDERMSATVIYSGAPQGWVTIDNANVSGATMKENAYNVRYFVVGGGGGGGGYNHGSGAGAGGLRTISCASFQVNVGTPVTVTVGAGGVGRGPTAGCGANGSSSVFSTITSAGGGRGVTNGAGSAGGSGAGGGSEGGGPHPGGAGNTPPVTPSQGNNGGDGLPGNGTGGGGAAGAVGSNGSGSTAGAGGLGASTDIMGSIPQAPSYGTPGPAPGRYFSGGGGGATEGGSNAAGGSGGGGQGGPAPGSAGAGVAGTANTGGGGGGGGRGPGTSGDYDGGTGGSGIVILQHVTADASPSVSGGNVTATCGSNTIRIFTGSGTFTP